MELLRGDSIQRERVFCSTMAPNHVGSCCLLTGQDRLRATNTEAVRLIDEFLQQASSHHSRASYSTPKRLWRSVDINRHCTFCHDSVIQSRRNSHKARCQPIRTIQHREDSTAVARETLNGGVCSCDIDTKQGRHGGPGAAAVERHASGTASRAAGSTRSGWLLLRHRRPQPASKHLRISHDVLPLIENHCLRCHSAAAQKGGLVMDTQQDLLEGGEHGAVLTPGDSKGSRLVQMLEGTRTPSMPDKGKPPLRPEDIAIFKAWIDAGAKESPTPPLTLDERLTPVPPEHSLLAAVNALAFSPDGLELAVPGYREVRRIGNASHGALTGPVDLVRGITYSRNGKWIACAGGIPGVLGEVLLWNAGTGELLHKLTGHRDYVYDADINHRSTRLATCSLRQDRSHLGHRKRPPDPRVS